MSFSATRAVDGAARRLPLGVSQRLVRRGVLGVNYHVVSDRFLPHVDNVLKYKSASLFEQDLRYLSQRHQVIGYDELVGASPQSAVRAARLPHGTPVTLTFDDGYAECFSVVRPILERFDLPCTFFVITGAADNRDLPYPNRASLCIDAVVNLDEDAAAERVQAIRERFGAPVATVDDFSRWMRSLHLGDLAAIDGVAAYLDVDWQQFLRDERPFMTSDEIRQLTVDGFTVGAHSVGHPFLGSLDDRDEIEREIVESCDWVRALTGQEHVPFAFPFSADGVDRAFLADVLARHDHIGLLFDTRELEQDRDFMVNRVAGDGGRAPYVRPNLPDVFHEAYGRHAAGRFRTLVRATGLDSARARLAPRSSGAASAE